MTFLLQVLWFLLPAGVANLIPPIAAKLLPRWDTPMDLGVSWRGQRLLGSHKTVRGLSTGVLMALLIHNLQLVLADHNDALARMAIDPAFHRYRWAGAWLGFTALMGDALKSFIKRQLQIAPGRAWLPWDKIDWILGCLLGSWLFFSLSVAFMVTAIVIGLVLSSAGRIIGYWLKINDDWL